MQRASVTVLVCLLVLGTFSVAAHAEEGLRSALFQQMQQMGLDSEPEPSPRGTTACVGGMAAGYPCNKVDLLAFLPNSTLGGGSGADIWGWTDPSTGREYALHSRSNGTSFVDITDPGNPVHVGNLPTHSGSVLWRDVKVYKDHAFIVSESGGHGMQVFDLRQLRGVVGPPVTFGETAHYGGFGSAHNVAIDEESGYAYAAGTTDCNSGLHIVDIRKPDRPEFAGCVDGDGYTHDAQCVVYRGVHTKWVGKEICFNYNEDTLSIFSLINKSQPELLSRTSYFGTGYTHQGWLTEDHRYLLLGDELDEDNVGHNTRTRIFRLDRLDGPEQIGTWDGPIAATDHNMYTKDGLLYQANYRGGLRILDLADIAAGNLTEIAYFDTYPASNSAALSSAWSVYPYLDSGTVVVSTYTEGLFILRPRVPEDFLLGPADATLGVCDPGQDAMSLTLTPRNGYSSNVTFSAAGLPAGATAQFDVNPVSTGSDTALTVSAAGAAPGIYAFDVEADDGSVARTVTLTLDVATQLPPAPGGLIPAHAASGVLRRPVLRWDAAAQASSYAVEIATDAAFTGIVYGAAETATEHHVEALLDPEATYFWRVTATNPCGIGAASTVRSFDTTPVPPILLIDDDDGDPDVRGAYTEALDALGHVYDVWDTQGSLQEPGATDLSPYETVIWFTGDDYFAGEAGPSPTAEATLAQWLDRSGCLLMAAQDYFYDRGLTPFMQTYLGVAGVGDDVDHVNITGQGPVFGGLGPFALAFPYANFSDDLQAGGGTVAFLGDFGDAGVQQGDDVSRTAYWGFGLEAIEEPVDREAALSPFVDWCAPLAGLDPDTDGVINADDCAPADGDAFAEPGAATDLVVGPGALAWAAPAVQGGTVVYDVLRAVTATGFDAATCVETGGGDTTAVDVGTPASGGVYFYLVRARNACTGSLGADSAGNPRTGADCQ